MDKITRMLILYSSLMNGDEINKTMFCFENDCSPRSFDRDIEDIRLFLSEVYSVSELKYNRINNTYYMNGSKRQDMEVMEYLFVEKIMKETSVLRKDEFDILKQHLFTNTRDSSKMLSLLDEESLPYKPPKHNKALLKIHGDLELAIRSQKYIRMMYQNDIGAMQTCDFVPCVIKYNQGYLWIVGYIGGEGNATCIELQQIHSFEILRSQSIAERKKVSAYIMKDNSKVFQKSNSNLAEIILECIYDDYEILKNVFDDIEILWQGNGLFKIRLNVAEDDFVHRYLIGLPETVTIIEPSHIKDRLVSQAQIILKRYGGRD